MSASEVPAVGVVGDRGSTIAIDAGDDYFSPPCVVVPSAETGSSTHVTIVVRNIGHHPHNLRVEGADAVSVDAGQVAFVSADVATDSLSYVCTIHALMIGELRRSDLAGT